MFARKENEKETKMKKNMTINKRKLKKTVFPGSHPLFFRSSKRIVSFSWKKSVKRLLNAVASIAGLTRFFKFKTLFFRFFSRKNLMHFCLFSRETNLTWFVSSCAGRRVPTLRRECHRSLAPIRIFPDSAATRFLSA